MGAIREMAADLSERESGPIFDVFFFSADTEQKSGVSAKPSPLAARV